MEWIFPKRAPMDSRCGRMVWIGSKNPHPFNRPFIYLARGANVKMPWLLAFARRVEDIQDLEKNRLAMPKTILCVGLNFIEAWFGCY